MGRGGASSLWGRGESVKLWLFSFFYIMIMIVVILRDELRLMFPSPLFSRFVTVYGYADDQFFMTCRGKEKRIIIIRGGSGGPWCTGSNSTLQITAHIGNSALYHTADAGARAVLHSSDCE